jgi:phage protein D
MTSIDDVDQQGGSNIHVLVQLALETNFDS